MSVYIRTVSLEKGVTCVTFASTKIGFDDLQQAGRELWELVDAGKLTRLIIDCDGVSFSDGMFGKLISLHMKCKKKAGGKMILCSLSPLLKGIYDMMQLQVMFPCFTNQAAALEQF